MPFRVTFPAIQNLAPCERPTLAQAVGWAEGVVAHEGLSDPELEAVPALVWWEQQFSTPNEAGEQPRTVSPTYDHDGGESLVIERMP